MTAHHNAQVDERAREVARASLVGKLPERDARWRLAGLVNDVSIPEDVARRFFGHRRWSAPDLQEVSDLAERIRALLVRKVAPREDGSGFISLQRIADGSSFCSLLRSFAVASAPSEHRNMRRVPAPILLDKDPTDGRAIAVSGQDRAELLLTVFLARAARQRPLRMVHERWRAVRSALDLPDPGRLETAEGQAALADRLVDESVAYAYVQRLLKDAALQPQREADDPMSVVWSTYTTEDLRSLVEHPPVVAYAAAKAAATPLPPPNRRAMAFLLESMTSVAEKAGNRFVPLMGDVVSSWSDSRTEIVGDEYNSWAPKPSEMRESDRARFEGAVARLVKAGFVLLGKHPDDVAGLLGERLDRIETEMAMMSA